MICQTCINWARGAGHALWDHHPNCPVFHDLSTLAYGIMLRRGWGVFGTPQGWGIVLPTMEGLEEIRKRRWGDPFYALIEADRLYASNLSGFDANIEDAWVPETVVIVEIDREEDYLNDDIAESVP